MSENTSLEYKWYVIHTYSGYENKVKNDIEKLVVNGGLEKYIRKILIPKETAYVEVKKSSKSSKSEADDELELIEELIAEEEGRPDSKKKKKKETESKLVERNKFPCYVFINMVMNDDTWFVVRNTRGVTSFVGPGSMPTPLSDEEVMAMELETITMADLDFKVGDKVRVISGVFADNIATVQKINVAKREVTVTITTFGRDIPTDMSISEIRPVE